MRAVSLNGTDQYCSKSSPVGLDLNATTDRITAATDRGFETSPATKSVYYNGTNAKTVLPASGLMNNVTDQFSAEIYFRVNTLGINQILYTYGWGDKYEVYVSAANKIVFTLLNESGTAKTIVSLETIALATWYHVVVRYNGINLYLYINGVGTTTNAVAQTGNIRSYTTAHGIQEAHASRGWWGNIEVSFLRIYNITLGASDVTTLYNNGRPYLSQNFFGAIAEYKGANANTSTWTDSSGNGFNGTQTAVALLALAGNWLWTGNHNIVQSNVDKKTGTYSGAIVSTGAGDQSANYVELPASAFTPSVIGEKYTVEVWARAVEASTTLNMGWGAAGATRGASATLSTVAGTFTKVVWNFQAAAGDIGQPLRVWLNQAATVYNDDNSLTQGWDAVVHGWARTSNIGTLKQVLHLAHASNNARLEIRKGTDDKLYFILSDGSGTTDIQRVTTNTINNSTYFHFAATVDRIGNGALYLNGALQGNAVSLALLGNITFAVLGIGVVNTLNGRYWLDDIGELQFIRFANLPADIATQIATAYTNAQNGLGMPTSWQDGTISAWYRWRGLTDGSFLADETGNNNLTGTNVTQAGNQVDGAYPTNIYFAGTFGGVSLMGATLWLKRLMTGVINGISDLYGALWNHRLLLGEIHATSSISGALGRITGLTGTIAALSSFTGRLKTRAYFDGITVYLTAARIRNLTALTGSRLRNIFLKGE